MADENDILVVHNASAGRLTHQAFVSRFLRGSHVQIKCVGWSNVSCAQPGEAYTLLPALNLMSDEEDYYDDEYEYFEYEEDSHNAVVCEPQDIDAHSHS